MLIRQSLSTSALRSPRSDRPKLPDLLVALQDRISWSDLKRLATHLTSHDLFPLLTDIEREYPCKEHAFRAWLERDCDASWGKVVSALRVISKNVLALEIEKKYCTPVGPIPQTSRGAPDVSEPQTPSVLDLRDDIEITSLVKRHITVEQNCRMTGRGCATRAEYCAEMARKFAKGRGEEYVKKLEEEIGKKLEEEFKTMIKALEAKLIHPMARCCKPLLKSHLLLFHTSKSYHIYSSW